MIHLIKEVVWEGGSLLNSLLEIKIYTLHTLRQNQETHSAHKDFAFNPSCQV